MSDPATEERPMKLSEALIAQVAELEQRATALESRIALLEAKVDGVDQRGGRNATQIAELRGALTEILVRQDKTMEVVGVVRDHTDATRKFVADLLVRLGQKE